MTSYAYISSFVGKGALGNRHLVVCLDKQRTSQCGFEFFSAPLPHLIQCVSEKTFENSANENIVFIQPTNNCNEINVRFFENQTEIKRCGSGSLAAAYFVYNYLNRLPDLRLITAAGGVNVGRNVSGYYFDIQRLPYTYPIQSLDWKSVVNQPVKSVVCVGGVSDYFVIELPSIAAVKKCRVNQRLLSLLSKRALIITAKIEKDRKASGWPCCVLSADYVLRYFLPQYGKYEDAATGSANGVLAAYWQKKLGRRSLRAWQLSSQGGKFKIEFTNGYQRVIGCVTASEQIAFHN